jgi:hypothetical protein
MSVDIRRFCVLQLGNHLRLAGSDGNRNVRNNMERRLAFGKWSASNVIIRCTSPRQQSGRSVVVKIIRDMTLFVISRSKRREAGGIVIGNALHQASCVQSALRVHAGNIEVRVCSAQTFRFPALFLPNKAGECASTAITHCRACRFDETLFREARDSNWRDSNRISGEHRGDWIFAMPATL